MVLPPDVDAAAIEHQQALVEMALVVDLKQPTKWDLGVAFAELHERSRSITARFAAVPKHLRARVDARARPSMDRGRTLIDTTFKHRDFVALRVALLAIEADVIACIIEAESERGN